MIGQPTVVVFTDEAAMALTPGAASAGVTVTYRALVERIVRTNHARSSGGNEGP